MSSNEENLLEYNNNIVYQYITIESIDDSLYISNYQDNNNLFDLNLYFPSVELIQRIFDDYIKNLDKLNIEQYNNSIIRENKKIDECPICFNSKEKSIKLINCNHSFCENCIENWLLNHKSTCPICRINVLNN